MGWDVCPSDTSKKDVVARLLREHGQEKIVAHKSTSSGLWMVYRCNDGVLRIFFDKIERHGKQFSSKSMSANMCPFAYDCPLEFLDLAPENDNQTWLKWAQCVKSAHERNKRVFSIGDQVVVADKKDEVYSIVLVKDKKNVVIKRLSDSEMFRCKTAILNPAAGAQVGDKCHE